jgi:hypothetical protein
MPKQRLPLRYGRIVYTWLTDHNGYSKLRPALVLSLSAEITEHSQLVVAAITTTFADPAPQFCVPLPWHPSGNCGTALRQRSAVVLNWLATIQFQDVVGFGGDVPARVMNIVQARLAELDE